MTGVRTGRTVLNPRFYVVFGPCRHTGFKSKAGLTRFNPPVSALMSD